MDLIEDLKFHCYYSLCILIFIINRVSKSKGFQRKRDYDPVQWIPYFDHSQDVKIGNDTFHIYTKGTEGPTLVLLHGGGYSALTWAEFTVGINY